MRLYELRLREEDVTAASRDCLPHHQLPGFCSTASDTNLKKTRKPTTEHHLLHKDSFINEKLTLDKSFCIQSYLFKNVEKLICTTFSIQYMIIFFLCLSRQKHQKNIFKQ